MIKRRQILSAGVGTSPTVLSIWGQTPALP